MKWFWYSLIGFCLFMCSCISKKVVSDVSMKNQFTSETAYMNESIKTDTTKAVRSIQLEEVKRMVEIITVTEYDTDKNVAQKVTKTERTIEQGSQAIAGEKKSKGVTEGNCVLVKHQNDFSKTTDSEMKEESVGGQEAFGKWFGIGLALIIGILIVYLLQKLRVN